MSKTREFHRPETWSKAHQLLNRSDVHTVPLAVSPRPVALTDLNADAFVDLEKLPLNYITQGEDGKIHVGALTTLQDLLDSDLIKSQAAGVLSEAVYLSATLGLRNLANVAGVLSNPDNPPEVALALMALEAVVTVQKSENQTRQVALQDWMKDCNNALLPGEVVLEVNFIAQPNAGGALARVARTPRDKAIVAAAAVVQVENGVCSQAVVTLAGANPAPVRLMTAEALLLGKSVNAELLAQVGKAAEEQSQAEGDYRGSEDYRKAMAGVLSKRAVRQAFSLG